MAKRERQLLNSWKEIAAYMGRSVRTLQRWERQLKLPIHRPAGKDRSAVLAFGDELDQWLNKTAVREKPYIRPLILVADPPDAGMISNRKLQLELRKFNVLTAFSNGEVLATMKALDPHAVFLDADLENIDAKELLKELKELYPQKSVVILTSKPRAGFEEADTVLVNPSVEAIVEQAVVMLGQPDLEPGVKPVGTGVT